MEAGIIIELPHVLDEHDGGALQGFFYICLASDRVGLPNGCGFGLSGGKVHSAHA
jgi:hypothetical protein